MQNFKQEMREHRSPGHLYRDNIVTDDKSRLADYKRPLAITRRGRDQGVYKKAASIEGVTKSNDTGPTMSFAVRSVCVALALAFIVGSASAYVLPACQEDIEIPYKIEVSCFRTLDLG